MKINYVFLFALLFLSFNLFAQENNFENAVSIGSGTPHASSMLHVNSTDKGILVPRMTLAQRNAIGSPATGLLIYQMNGTPGFYFYNGSSWTSIGQDSDWIEDSGSLYTTSNDVGIGTAGTPFGTLHLKLDGTTIYDGLHLETSLGTAEDWYYYMNPDDDLVIRNDANDFFRIQKNTGNVAIGTVIADGYRLSVDGKIATEEVLIDISTAWPDYVFSDDYNLLSIDEFAKSIEKNKHLPGIPSAKEVEANGILAGDMHKRTMEKIEELSLYIIELHERIKVLESEKCKESTIDSE